MTRSKFPSFCFLPVVFALIAVSATVHANGDDDDALGSKIAGAWLGHGSVSLDFDCNRVPDTPPLFVFFDLNTFESGGEFLVSNPTNGNTERGVWRKTGPRQVTTTSMNFTAPPGGGILDAIFVARGPYDFDRAFELGTTTFHVDIFDWDPDGDGVPNQDPLDPSEVPVICTVGEKTIRRLPAE